MTQDFTLVKVHADFIQDIEHLNYLQCTHVIMDIHNHDNYHLSKFPLEIGFQTSIR